MGDVTYQRMDSNLLSSELTESEVVMLNVAKGEYYGCEGVAKTIWDALDHASTLEEIVAIVAAEYPDSPATVSDEVQAFLDELLDNALVRRAAV